MNTVYNIEKPYMRSEETFDLLENPNDNVPKLVEKRGNTNEGSNLILC